MCDSPVPLELSFPLFFDTEPVRIGGCPSDFELTAVERRALDHLAARERSITRRSQPKKLSDESDAQ